MSDFTSGFWSLWVIVLTLGGIAFCAWLLLATGRGVPRPADGQGVGTTGHVWDGDLEEIRSGMGAPEPW